MRHSTLLTEFTDISQRLEYLVAHSSQMIFVTGEDLAIQQGFVEAFLGQQSAYANVAFLTARRGKSAQFFRQQLAEQLNIGALRNKQSLAQLFASRDDKAEPVIIAMTSAENIPEEVLRELWDLVLQNRFTRNGEQINILMFGDQEWAEEVKSWLPTNNNDKPVLLTTQTLEYDEETEVEGDLDEMIANRRKLFKERMKSRAQSHGESRSLLHFWWMKLFLAGVFLVSFASILIWQYFDVTKSALDEFTQFIFQQNAVEESRLAEEPNLSAGLTLEEALVLEQGEASESQQKSESDVALQDDFAYQENGNQRVAANFAQAMNRLEALDSQKQSKADEAPVAALVDTSVSISVNETADSPNSVTIAEISTEQLIQLRDGGTMTAAQEKPGAAVSLPQASAATALAPEPLTNAANETMAIEAVPTDPESIALRESIFEAIVVLEAMESEVTTGISAFQLEKEIVAQQNQGQEAAQAQPLPPASVAESARPEVLQAKAQPGPQQQNDVVQDYPVQDMVNDDVVATQQLAQQESNIQDSNVGTVPNESAGVAYQFHEELLLELPNDTFVLQLSGITTESLLEEYLVDNQMLNSVWVYKTQRYGGDWFVVLFNQSFDSLEAARGGVSLLSGQLQSVSPFAKSISQIKNEILSN